MIDKFFYKFFSLIDYLFEKIEDVWTFDIGQENKKKKMKFILIISLCSFINNQCLPPAQIQGDYNSWKECTLAAIEISKQLIIAQEDTFINNNKVATKFMCEEIKEI